MFFAISLPFSILTISILTTGYQKTCASHDFQNSWIWFGVWFWVWLLAWRGMHDFKIITTVCKSAYHMWSVAVLLSIHIFNIRNSNG